MEVIKAIEQMLAQGAGDIAITARYGLYLAKLKSYERQYGDRVCRTLRGHAIPHR